jgi:ketosteroid isomerase-like protein
MKTPFRLALLAAALALAGQAAAQAGPLDGMSQKFEEHVRKGEVDAIGAMYAEDGMILPPNHARVQGRTDIAAFIKGMTDAGLSLKLVAENTWMDGKLAVRQGSYTLLDKEQKEVERGKWVEVWQQGADGNWLMVRDIWNADAPPTPPPTPGVSGDKD